MPGGSKRDSHPVPVGSPHAYAYGFLRLGICHVERLVELDGMGGNRTVGDNFQHLPDNSHLHRIVQPDKSPSFLGLWRVPLDQWVVVSNPGKCLD